MRFFPTFILYSILVLFGCSERAKRPEEELLLNYPTEEEKVLNEAFLQVVGTDLYYKFSDRHLEEVRRMENSGASENEIIKYYEKHKEEDSKKVVVFTRDEFLSTYSKKHLRTIHSNLLADIRHGLERSNFMEVGDSATQLLETLSQPLKISSINLSQTGRYELVKEKDKDKVKGEYKTYGSFNTSKVFIDKNRKKAAFFFERNCMEGSKCATGTLVLLKKENNRWQVSKQINIYLT